MDLITFGAVFLEIVFGNVPALPGPGEEIYAEQFAVSCGGAAVSAAVAAVQAGATAGLATVLGDDLGSALATAYCERAGVDTSPSRRVQGSVSGVTAVMNFDGDRAFLSHLPAAGQLAAGPDWWPDVVAAIRPGWIYLYARAGALPVIDAARSVGCRVAVDSELGTIRTSPQTVLECAAAADLFLPNRAELEELTGTTDPVAGARALAAPGTTVVIKEGAQGAVVVCQDHAQRIVDGVRDLGVLDRTGAGDAFAGALIGSLARGAGLVAAVTAGNAAGSAAVARLGAAGPLDLMSR